MKIIADFYKYQDVKGGVQIVMEDFRRVYPDVKIVSFKDACRVLSLPPVDYNKAFRFPEHEANMILQRYIKKLEVLSKPEVIIYNSLCGGAFKHQTPTISVIHDNNMDGPDILFNHGFYDAYNHNAFRNIFFRLQTDSIKNADLVVAPSNQVAEAYRKFCDKEIKVIPHGVDTEMFKPLDKAELRTRYGLPIDAKVIVWSGMFHPIKGYHILQKLIRMFPGIIFIVNFKINFGKKPKLKNVMLVENQPRGKMPEIYNLGDAFLCTSACESFGLTNVEALSCNVPIITSKVGCFWDYWDEKLGYRIEKWDDVEAYAKAITDLFHKDKLSPREVITKQFNMTLWTNRWREVIEGVKR